MKLEEEIARVIDPRAWEGTGHTSVSQPRAQENALEKARAIVALFHAQPVCPHCKGIGEHNNPLCDPGPCPECNGSGLDENFGRCRNCGEAL